MAVTQIEDQDELARARWALETLRKWWNDHYGDEGRMVDVDLGRTWTAHDVFELGLREDA